MTKISLKPKKLPKIPPKSKITKIPLKPIKWLEYPKTYKMNKITPKPKKITKIPPKPKKKRPKYPQNLTITKIHLNLKNYQNTS